MVGETTYKLTDFSKTDKSFAQAFFKSLRFSKVVTYGGAFGGF